MRVRFDDNHWRKAEVARVLPHRSYEVRFEDGTTRRRTSRHVRFSSEPPIVIRADDGDDTAAARQQTVAATPADHQPRPRHGRRQGNQRATRSSAGQSTKQPPTTTCSGRVVKPPARFND